MTGNDKVTNGAHADDAGIIPRVLYQLFTALSLEGVDAAIKCSFIELYNEDLRDLISDDDSRKITITDSLSSSRKSTGVTRGQENVFIESAEHGLEVLQHGLRKRQVAETKMNDLSSRSHTIFTLTVYVGMRSETPNTPEVIANDACIVGKINLVDLAGSENIGKSGAENKRAREAGMINQSLLTLGRVINALVDKSPHIPYRESKLTRLLQDSLGGQTRTCIIATISPAQINLEETLSTLEYASKAKSIKNKPQVGSLVSKTTMFKEWSDDFIRLRRDWDATRKKNGTYLAEEHYKELLSENDERQLRIDEQERKLVTVDGQLKSSREVLDATKIQLMEAKKQLTSTSNTLSKTMSSLASTEQVLKSTKSNLSEETKGRQAHASTETELLKIGADLIQKLDVTVADLNVLQDMIDHRNQLDDENKEILQSHGSVINQSYSRLEVLLNEFCNKNQLEIKDLQAVVQSFKNTQTAKIKTVETDIDGIFNDMETECKTIVSLNESSQVVMGQVMSSLENVRSDIKEKITNGLGGLGGASQRVADTLGDQITKYKNHTSVIFEELGTKCHTVFSELQAHTDHQSATIVQLNEALIAASRQSCNKSQEIINNNMVQMLQEEEACVARERMELMLKFEEMIADKEKAHTKRLGEKMAEIRESLGTQQLCMAGATDKFETGMSEVLIKQQALKDEVLPSMEKGIDESILKSGQLAQNHTTVMDSTVQQMREDIQYVIEKQVSEVGGMLTSFDEFVNQIKTESDNQQSQLTDRFQAMDKSVRTNLKSVQIQMQSACLETAEFDPVLGFEAKVSEAWNKVADESSEVASTARAQIEQVKYLTDEVGNKTKPSRRTIEYPHVLPSTAKGGLNIPGSSLVAAVGSNPAAAAVPLQVQPPIPMPVPMTMGSGEQRCPLSDISKTGNEVVAEQLPVGTLLKEQPAVVLKKRRPGFLQVYSPKKRTKTSNDVL